MKTLTISILLAVAAAIIYFVWYSPQKKDGETLFADSVAGNIETTIDSSLPRSFNQPEGATYSYSMWILVKDFTTGYGQRRTIMNKGDSPGIYLDSTSNAFVVAIKTYGTTETILVPNIPAMKWIHLAVVVNQEAVDIYINGTLRQHHTLSQLPDQTEDAVKIGPNWNGVVGRIVYYPKSLTYSEIHKLSQEAPPPDMVPKISKPNYFDMSWYVGRLNSA